MPKNYKKHKISPDPRYNNVLVARFINKVMQRGQKQTARKIVYSAFDIIKDKTKQDPVTVFEKAIYNVSPSQEVRPQRVGGATYQVPRSVNSKRKKDLAMRWVVNFARSRTGQPMQQRLAGELMDAFDNKGEAMRKRNNMHKMAAANRAFAHLAR